MYAEWSPDPALSGRIACLWRLSAEKEHTQLVVPDGCVDLIWGPEGPFVAGPDTGPIPTPVRPGDSFTGVRFRPGAVGDVLGLPLSELRDQRVPLADLGTFPPLELGAGPAPGSMRVLPRQAQAAGSPGARGEPDPLPVLCGVVADRLRRTPPPDPAAPVVAASLRRGRSVREVARDLGLSERQLHRRTVAGFGYAPKTLQRIVRFQYALRLARSGVPAAEVAAVAGYTDGAHLAHDVKRLSGGTLTCLVT